MMDNFGTGADKGRGDEERKNKLARAIAYAIAAVFLIAAIVCFAVYASYGNEVLFIPAALCLVVTMLSFTFARTRRG